MQRVATGYGLIEGPVWDAGRGLYFSDVINGGVHLLERSGDVTLAVPKRRGIGGMALHDSGGLIVGGRDIACVSLADGTIEDDIIECPKHNGRFDYRTGKALGAPVIEDLRTYRTKVESDGVYIQLGE